MRPALYLLLVLLPCWQALSAGLDPGSGDGPTEDPHRSSSSSIGTSSTIRAVTEGSGGVPDDDEDSVVPSSVTTAVTTSAATSSASRSVVTTVQASDGGDDEGSGAPPVRYRCDSGTTELSQCYCVDETNEEIPGTRGRTNCKPVEEEPIVPQVAVTYGRSVSPTLTSAGISTGEIVIDEDATTVSVPSPAATSSVPITTQTSAAAVQTTTLTMTTAATSTTAAPSTTTVVPSTTTAAPSTPATTITTMPSVAIVTTAVSTRTATLKPTTARHAPSTVRHVHAHPTTTFSNEVPYNAGKDNDGRESQEESSNQINTAAESLNSGASHESSGGLHPGLLAAIIGGGVVGLLCAILLIMFIVYRMRKKDEGSYPLDDGKPRALYKSPPSKEFYA